MFRLIIQGFDGADVGQASQARVVVGMNDAMQEGIALVVGGEPVFAAVRAGGGMVSQCFGETAVEAFDHAVGLGVEGFGQAVVDAVGFADQIEGVVTGGFAVGLALHVDGEAVGELAAVIGENDMNAVGEGCQESLQAEAMVLPSRRSMISMWTKRVARSMATKT